MLGAAQAGEVRPFEELDWSWVHPRPLGSALASVASSGDVYIAVGQTGMAMRRQGDSSFLPVSTPVHDPLSSIIWDGQQFVALSRGRAGQTQSTPILLSADGSSWSVIDSGLNIVGLDGLAYNGSIYVIGSPDALLYGPNLANLQTSPAFSSTIFDVDWDGEQFVAVGSNGGVFTTVDGTSVTPVDTGLTGTVRGTARNGDTWVLVEFFNVATSEDAGTTWETTLSATGLTSVIWDGQQFIVFRTNGTFYTSPDGVDWTEQPALPNASAARAVADITRGNSGLLAVGGSGALYTSSNGTDWTFATGLDFDSSPRSMAWDGNRFVFAGFFGEMISSTDRLTWNASMPFAETMTFVAWSGQQFYAVGHGGTGGTSPDGITWSDFDTGSGRRSSGYGDRRRDFGGGGPKEARSYRLRISRPGSHRRQAPVST